MKRILLLTIIIAILAMGCLSEAETIEQLEGMCAEVNFDVLSGSLDGVVGFDQLTLKDHTLVSSAESYDCHAGSKTNENVNNIYCEQGSKKKLFAMVSTDAEGNVESTEGGVIVRQLVFSDGELAMVNCAEALL